MRYTNTYPYTAPYTHTYLKTPMREGFIGLERNSLAVLRSNKNSALE